MNLQDLIFEASTELGSDACLAGKHLWESVGGRGCPHDENNGRCGQAVYRCSVCGGYDYGERGGPGAKDCEENGRCEFRGVAPNAKVSGAGTASAGLPGYAGDNYGVTN